AGSSETETGRPPGRQRSRDAARRCLVWGGRGAGRSAADVAPRPGLASADSRRPPPPRCNAGPLVCGIRIPAAGYLPAEGPRSSVPFDYMLEINKFSHLCHKKCPG
ncbi:Hypothetical predicted protein, partial [Marmota monax]